MYQILEENLSFHASIGWLNNIAMSFGNVAICGEKT